MKTQTKLMSLVFGLTVPVLAVWAVSGRSIDAPSTASKAPPATQSSAVAYGPANASLPTLPARSFRDLQLAPNR